MKIHIESMTRPALFHEDGKTFIVPDWKPVPEGTKLSDVEWTDTTPKAPPRPTTRVIKVPSEKNPSKHYLVTFWSTGRKECTCPGFTYRRFCKHTNAAH